MEHGADLPARREREGGLISMQAIVNAFVFLHSQPPRGWLCEIDVRTGGEKW
jgi:hypothetical protein